MITGGMQGNLPEGFFGKGDFADPVAGGVELLEHFQQCGSLFTAG
jgi:hypothetical protein